MGARALHTQYTHTHTHTNTHTHTHTHTNTHTHTYTYTNMHTGKAPWAAEWHACVGCASMCWADAIYAVVVAYSQNVSYNSLSLYGAVSSSDS